MTDKEDKIHYIAGEDIKKGWPLYFDGDLAYHATAGNPVMSVATQDVKKGWSVEYTSVGEVMSHSGQMPNSPIYMKALPINDYAVTWDYRQYKDRLLRITATSAEDAKERALTLLRPILAEGETIESALQDGTLQIGDPAQIFNAGRSPDPDIAPLTLPLDGIYYGLPPIKSSGRVNQAYIADANALDERLFSGLNARHTEVEFSTSGVKWSGALKGERYPELIERLDALTQDGVWDVECSFTHTYIKVGGESGLLLHTDYSINAYR